MRMLCGLIIMLLLLGILPTMAQEATAEPIELVETFSDEAIPVQFNYPEGWVTNATDTASIYISNSEDTLSQSFGDPFENGEVNLLIGAFTLEYLNGELELNLEPGTKPRQVVQALVDKALGELTDAPESIFGAVEDITIGGQRAATVVTGIEDYFGGRLWIKQFAPDVFTAVQLIADYDEVSDWEATALAILDTISYGEAEASEIPELTQTVTSQNGKVTFSYPTDWETSYESSEQNTAVVVNSRDAFGYTLGDDIPRSAVSIIAGGYSTEEIHAQMGISSEVTPEIILETVTETMQYTDADQSEWTISEIESLTVDGQSAATVTISHEGFADQAWVIEIEPGVFAFVSLLTHPDELEYWTATALAIGKTVTYSE